MSITFEQALEYASTASTEEIEQFYTVLKQRSKIARQIKASLNASLLRKGDRVRLSDNMSPQYLRGLEVTVDRVSGSKVSIRFDEDTGKFIKDYPVQVPASAVTKID